MARHSRRGRGSPPPISAFLSARSFLVLRVDAGHAPRLLQVCGAPVLAKFEEHSRSAQTDPHAVALYGVALATLDDDHGLRPDAHGFIVDKAPWFMVTDDLPQSSTRIPARTHHTIPDRPIAAIARVAEGVQGHKTSMKSVSAGELTARSRFNRVRPAGRRGMTALAGGADHETHRRRCRRHQHRCGAARRRARRACGQGPDN
jgi:hypothetical protein